MRFSTAAAQPAHSSGNVSSPLTCAEIETFLRTAKIGVERTATAGVTQPKHAMLDDGTRRHEAYIQTVLITPDWQVWRIDFTRAFRARPQAAGEPPASSINPYFCRNSSLT